MIPPFSAGQHWSFERTARFLSSEAGIDLENDDRFDFKVVANGERLWMEVSHWQTGTRLPEGVFVKAPAPVEPEVWQFPIAKDGLLELGKQPRDRFERLLAQMLLSGWNEKPSVDSIALKPLGPGRERLSYDGSGVQDAQTFTGTFDLDPQTGAPVTITLTGQNVLIPGGSDRVSVRVEYRPSKK